MVKRKYLMDPVFDEAKCIKDFKRFGATNIKLYETDKEPLSPTHIFFILDDKDIPKFNIWLKKSGFINDLNKDLTGKDYQIKQSDLKNYIEIKPYLIKIL